MIGPQLILYCGGKGWMANHYCGDIAMSEIINGHTANRCDWEKNIQDECDEKKILLLNKQFMANSQNTHPHQHTHERARTHVYA